jgi:hypothetical protein
MRPAATRAFTMLLLAVSGMLTGSAAAGSLDPIGTATSVVSTVTSQATVVSGLTGSVSSDSALGTIGGALESTDAATGSALFPDSQAASGFSPDAGGGSPSTSRDRSAGSANGSNAGSPRTRFHRLPKRYEMLLERSGVFAETVDAVASASSIHEPADSPGRGRGGILGLGLPLSPALGVPYQLLIVLVTVAGLLLILSRTPRQFLPSSVRGLVELHQLETWVLPAAIGLALLTGFLVVAMIQVALL